jgi:site-specific recombinase XerD
MNLSGTGIPENEAAALEELGRHGLAKKTWSTYSTAERLLSKFHKEKGIERKLPLSEETTLRFIHWLAKEKNLKAGTINSYLAGIRQLHVARVLPDPEIRSSTVNLILKGMQNKENIEKRKQQKERKPATAETMAALKSGLRNWKANSSGQPVIRAGPGLTPVPAGVSDVPPSLIITFHGCS